MEFYGILGFLNIPKWLIKVTGLLQYFLDHFWNFQNVHQIWTFSLLFLGRNASTNTRKYGNIFKHTFTYHNIFENPKKSQIDDTTGHQTCWFFVFCFKSGGSETIGFSERFQRILRGWILDKSLRSPNLQNLGKSY